MQDDHDNSAMTPDPAQQNLPSGGNKPGEKDPSFRGDKPGSAAPMPDAQSDEAMRRKTGQGQGQSAGRPQTQPPE
jgi:hypothetical protein